MTVTIGIKNSAGVLIEESPVLSFNFKKDIYTPYSSLSALICPSGSSYNNAAEIILSIDGTAIHHGLVDSLKLEQKNGCSIMSISSRGFTSLLCQNQIEPGLQMNISFNMLMDDFYTLPYVIHEDDPDTSGYLYIRPNTSMWDAAASFSYKRMGTYPYIRGTNTVMMSPYSLPNSFDLSSEKLISEGTEILNSRLASDYHMADIQGEYGSFDLSDSDVSDLKIIRHKCFDLDMRFLYEPQEALVFRDKYDFRGRTRYFSSYSGYSGEDLYDLVSFDGTNYEPIGSVSVRGSHKGVFTEIGVYSDKFPHS